MPSRFTVDGESPEDLNRRASPHLTQAFPEVTQARAPCRAPCAGFHHLGLHGRASCLFALAAVQVVSIAMRYHPVPSPFCEAHGIVILAARGMRRHCI